MTRFTLLRTLTFTVMFTALLQGGITGRVVDASTGTPVAGARVETPGVPSVRTDSTGRFSFATLTEGLRVITVSHIAFARFEGEFRCSEATSLLIPLTPSAVTMPDVIVRSTRGTQPVRRSAVPSAVVPGNDAASDPSGGPMERLSAVPGISAASDGPWSAAPSIRGLSRSNTVLAVDDVRLEAATDIAGVLSMVDPYDLERIEVVKGPGSVMNGTASSGGAVNCIVRRAPFTEEPAARFEAVIGAADVNDARTLHAAAEGSNAGARFRVSALYRTADDYRTAAGTVPNSRFTDGGFSLSGGARLGERQTVDLLVQEMQGHDIGIPGGSAIASAATAEFPFTRRSLVRGEYTVTDVAPVLHSLSVRISRQSILRNVRIVQSPAVTLTPHAEHETYAASAEARLRPAEGHAVSASVEAWERRLVSRRERYAANGTVTTEAPLPDSRFASIGAFLSDEWDVPSLRSVLTAGVRADRIMVRNDAVSTPLSVVRGSDGFPLDFIAVPVWPAGTEQSTAWSAMAGVRHSPAEGWDCSLLYSTAYRAATLEERFQYIQLGGPVRAGNPALRPERSGMVNAAVRWTGLRSAFSAELFHTSLRDLITEVPGTFNGAPAQVKTNIGSAFLYGYELAASASLTRGLLLHLRAAYVRGEDRSGGTDLPMMPPLTAGMTVEWRAPEAVTVSLDLSAAADQRRTGAGESPTGGYAEAGLRFLSAPFDMAGTSVTVGGGIKNIGDRLFRNHLSTVRGMNRNEPGRNIYVTMMVTR